VVVIRYADDFVIGFEHKYEAEACLEELRARFAKFGLKLHGSKTRLIEFGRFAAARRRAHGERRPETFDFLGFTHCCAKTRQGHFKILRLTVKKRLRATLVAIRGTLKRRRHEPIGQVGAWLTKVLRGYFNYHAVPDNLKRLTGFRWEVCRAWFASLNRRSQKKGMTGARFSRLAKCYLPYPRRVHPYPSERFAS
jgi:hypothetical protein